VTHCKTRMSIRCNSKLSPTFPAGILYTIRVPCDILLPPWKQARARDYQSGGNSFGRGGFSPARFPTWLTSTECSVFSLAFIIIPVISSHSRRRRDWRQIYSCLCCSPLLYIYADDVFISTSSAASAQYPADNSIDTRFIIIQTGRGRFTLQDRIKKKDAVSLSFSGTMKIGSGRCCCWWM